MNLQTVKDENLRTCQENELRDNHGLKLSYSSVLSVSKGYGEADGKSKQKQQTCSGVNERRYER